jgi:uncharacterized protein
MKLIRFLVLLLMVAGAVNWGLWGLYQYDLIQDFFGSNRSLLARALYGAIGLAGVFGISFFFVPEIYKGRRSSQK